jgi:hypothetical protein
MWDSFQKIPYLSETESFMEVGQGPNVGCSAKGKKMGLFLINGGRMSPQPITLAARSKAWTVFARSKAGIVGSNPNRGMDVCVCVYSVFVLFCVYLEALRRADPPSKKSYWLCIGSRNWKSGQGPTKGCRTIIIIICPCRKINAYLKHINELWIVYTCQSTYRYARSKCNNINN